MKDIIRVLKKYRQIMNRGQKLRVGIIVVMMLIGGILETMSVSLILPLVTAIMKPDFLETNQLARAVCDIFDLHSINSFMILVMIGLMLLYIVKNVFLYLEYYTQIRFVCNNRFALQQRLMHSYLSKPYEYFLNENTAEIMRVIQLDTDGAFLLLQTLMSLFTELIICVALVATIIVVDYSMALMAASILMLLMIFLAKIMKPILRNAGIQYQENSTITNKWLLQAMQGIKEVKVGSREIFFVEQYSKAGIKSIESEKKKKVLDNVPRLMIETITIVAMLFVITVMLLNGRNIENLMPQLSAFAMAAVRLLPSTNRVSTAYNAIAYQEPMLDKMLSTLEIAESSKSDKPQKIKQNDFKLDKKIELKDISYRYPNTSKDILDHANMIIPIGKSIGIVGASGSGKTTTVDILLGLLKPYQGNVLIDGNDINQDFESWLQQLSYIPQSIYLLDGTIRENIAFGYKTSEIDDDRIWKALQESQMEDFVKRQPQGLDTEIGEMGVRLSGGQRQRIGIARALYKNPKVIVFDEATSALDNETESAIIDSINQLKGKKTLIIIAHRLTTIEECDIVYRVEGGQIKLERS